MRLHSLRSSRRAVVLMATAALLAQPPLLLAEQRHAVMPAPVRAVDVALGANGVLHGQAVGGQGQPAAATGVRISDGRRVWDATTDEHGRFVVEGLVGSVYEVRAGAQRMIVRAWRADAAPPKAARSLLIVADDRAVRGQACECGSAVCSGPPCGAKHGYVGPFILGGVVASAIAIPVAIHNSDDDPRPASP